MTSGFVLGRVVRIWMGRVRNTRGLGLGLRRIRFMVSVMVSVFVGLELG
jgi:hypothetical protein